jgi:PAS domain S-box-containing protein
MTSILVVDDRPIDRQLLVTLLGYVGYHVLEAGDGQEALEMARAEQPDLMIADVLMPTMDGLELVRQLRADSTTAGIRVIFCTASYLLDEVATLAEQSGVTYILSKPIEPEDALKVIGAALDLPSPPVPIIQPDMFHEEHLKVLVNKTSHLSSQLGHVVPRLAALIELGHQLASERDPLYLLQIFCHTARDIVGSKYAAVAILNDDGQTIRHFLTSGMGDEETIRIGALPQGKGLLHNLLVENGPVRVNNIGIHPQSVGFPPRHPPMRTFLGVPIISPSRRYGSFYLTEKLGDGSFDHEDEQIVVTLAAQVAVAYENARRYDDLQREMAKREEAENLLRQSEIRFRALTENSADGIAMEDASGGLIYITRAFTRITGYRLEDLRGLHREDLYHPDDMEAVENRRASIQQPGAIATGEHRLRHKNGSWRWLEITSQNLLDEPGINAIVANLRDITERKEAEAELEKRVTRHAEELQRARDHVEAMLRTSGDAIIVAGRDGNIRQTNPAFNTLFGYEINDVIQHALIELVEPDEGNRLTGIMQDIVEGKSPVRRFDIVARRKDTTVFHADVALSGIYDWQNKIVDIVCSVRDSSARKQLEIQLRESLEREKELNELKSHFISIASHDFRTPLAVILSSTDTYHRYADRMSEEQKARHFTRIREGVARMIDLLEEILAYSSTEEKRLAFNPVPLNLKNLCHAIVEEVQTATGDTNIIEFSARGSYTGAAADEKLVRQIVTNLLSNAIKYSPKGNSVQFDLLCIEGQAIFRLRDQGIGIPENDQSHLFEPFYRAHNTGNIHGTGLGLVIVKKAVDLHGGMITFESEQNIGTTFTVMLPIWGESDEA